MAALTVTAALAIASACAPIDERMLVAIAQGESSLEQYTILDNTTKQAARGPQVVALASKLIEQGHSVDLGLFGINSRNLGILHLSVSDAFDLCQGAEASYRMLQLLSRYNTGSPSKGIANGYATGVATRLAALRGLPVTSTPQSAPLVKPAEPIEDTPAIGQLFFSTRGH